MDALAQDHVRLAALVLPTLVAVLPVLCFLVGLQLLDSFKLLRLRWVLLLVLAGAVLAGCAALANSSLLGASGWELDTYSRYLAPWVEELLKALIVALLIRGHRVGFLVDAAIVGFAVGAGFAAAENLWYLRLAPDAAMVTWVIRGFGTALMHGGATALFAMLGLALIERHPDWRLLAFAPGLALAVLLHAGFNHVAHLPQVAALAMLVLMPLVMAAAYQHSERATRDWLGLGFDHDVAMLELLDAPEPPTNDAAAHTREYLRTLRERALAQGEAGGLLLADMLSYLRLYTELSLRAKGLLMMRDNGFEAEPGDDAPALLAELEQLERSIGRTGLRAVRPLLRMRHKDLWQLMSLRDS